MTPSSEATQVESSKKADGEPGIVDSAFVPAHGGAGTAGTNGKGGGGGGSCEPMASAQIVEWSHRLAAA